MPLSTRNRKGQALLMVTLTLVAMFGIMGLAVDLGWSFYVRKAAQAAADTAALAAAQGALTASEDSGVLDSSTAATTPSGPVGCPGAPANLGNGCTYARQNGFPKTSAQKVLMEADLGSVRPPPTAPGVPVDYWVTTRVQEDIPQLFSAVIGKFTGRSGARATAAIVEVDVPGALILLNRQSDCVAMNGPNSVVCGVNLNAQGSSNIKAKSGILMASTRHGDDLGIPRDGPEWAGYVAGSSKVESDFTAIRGMGAANVSKTDPRWQEPWQAGFSDSPFFRDPMRNLGQPAPPPSGLPSVPVSGCAIVGGADAAHTLVLTPGKYYSVRPVTGAGGCYDGDPITINGYVEFAADSSGFANYTFFGGLRTVTSTNITFNPGRYVFAGVKPVNHNSAGSLFDVSSGQVILQDKTPLAANGSVQANTDAGELFIFTDANYPGIDKSGVPLTVTVGLDFGTSGFKAGNNNNVTLNLHGLNTDATGVPSNLEDFSQVLLWQDRRNSTTNYFNADGSKNMTCIIGDTPCVNSLSHSDSPNLWIQASAAVHLYGVIYQPRGAWTTLGGGPGYAGPLRIITGAISFQGNADLDLTTLQTPMKVRTVALIE
jgi:hypothetical protein